jgi:Co/Zn/Cd efflux system component
MLICPVGQVGRFSQEPEVRMRKMIMMAVAGFIWRQIQARVFKRAHTGRTFRRF